MYRLRGLGRGGRLLLALAVGGALFGIASVVQADVPDSGVIHGCYKTVGGALRVIDTDKGATCNSGESALPWSQTGPKGTTGARGPTGLNGTNGTNGAAGATGPTGPTGPSDGFAGLNDDSFGTQQLQPFNETTVQALNVPAGSYLVNASLAFVSTAPGFVHCQLFLGTNYHGGQRQYDVASGDQIVPFTAAFTTAAATTASIQCLGSTTTSTQPSQMTAVRVATLTISN